MSTLPRIELPGGQSIDVREAWSEDDIDGICAAVSNDPQIWIESVKKRPVRLDATQPLPHETADWMDSLVEGASPIAEQLRKASVFAIELADSGSDGGPGQERADTER